MIALLIGILVVAGCGVGWYGHKASLRIEAWGCNSNTIDRIFLKMSAHEGSVELWRGKARFEEASVEAASVSPLFPVAAAVTK